MKKLKHSANPAATWTEAGAPLWRKHNPLKPYSRLSHVYWARVGTGPASPVLSLPCSLSLGDLEQSTLLDFLTAKMDIGALSTAQSCPAVSMRWWAQRCPEDCEELPRDQLTSERAGGGGESPVSTLEVCQFYWSFQGASFRLTAFLCCSSVSGFVDSYFYFYYVLPSACFHFVHSPFSGLSRWKLEYWLEMFHLF